MKQKTFIYSLLLLLVSVLSSCSQWEGETVESAYQEPQIPDPTYQFKRNGASSVDYLECSLLRDPLDYIYSSYLRTANIMYEGTMTRVKGYYNNGEFGLKPQEELAASSLHKADRERILKDVEDIFVTTGKLSGLGQPSPGTYRNHKAKMGEGGYVGVHIGDVNIAFANEKGLVVAELFNGIVWGGIYLDKILNVHLNDSLYNDARLRSEHERTALLPGRNYTELEHHWDLAYGYYQYWLPYVQVGGLPVLRESRIKLYNAFARGRLALTEYRYEEVLQQLQLIRAELSKVAAVRAMNLLVNDITVGNLDEDINNALVFLSQGCGALYGLQFTLQESGKPHLTYEQVKSYINELTSGNGFWDKERLLGDEATVGSLKHVASQVGKVYGLTLNDIKRSY
ncbi:DUF4856 domain-containing protein [Prevotella fusca JCM 17724]|uniref:DUF4856 domain-containing protein n=1 Tax=Prevotella fusca JCM 17724 TaxID=1236517 RepID=A0A0K1NP28_9BACT|nr:DUF4856 domain-containing protein [Prevotella fusca]AKU70638.1 hypothetical protein ADJ77_13100 [Prevotella fusca JCM 17724]QUB85317.1 DUF4856 domain-containing protein [Prevotella fusca JCM 17724]